MTGILNGLLVRPPKRPEPGATPSSGLLNFLDPFVMLVIDIAT